ncbi:hypothetical protein [Sporosarcina pasteurii]|uniref:LysM domain-containing protein n=1 Tax=Sporosarcina pasteurii TaxID=1474 RepID=A0A380BND7_SPOPA|nr:hypothetical protein [Sporosarcina pasteurii]MDS9471056.1 hypothetical protein [Sporosarcina pasteurii]QBQ05300.1 hypothetical protein E2C16_06260 [Sporosarcina pasteurii]SUJ04175.1 Uncharacterised protein [Sporosarcina pasteurii]
MRILLLAAAIFLTIHFVRIDFVEGTIPQKPTEDDQVLCEDETRSIPVTSIHGDTIESLFALYPDAEIGFIDRLEQFYTLNPHLKLQGIVGGETILIPLSNSEQNKCE